MKKIRTHNGRELNVPSSHQEDLDEARLVATRSWRLLVESLDIFQQAEILFQERTELAKQRCGVKTITVEVVKEREADEMWRASIADADYALKRMTAMAAAGQVALSRLDYIR